MIKVSYDVLGMHKHNIDSYEAIKDTFLSGENFAAIVHATGTGKTFNALQLMLENPDKRFVFVTPYNSIIEHVKSLMNDVTSNYPEYNFNNVEFYTYNAISAMSDEELKELDVDYLILDEFHHIGAPVWGERIEKLIELHEDLKVLGISAYTVRDRGTIYERDMVASDGNEIFSDCVVSRYDLVDAMVDGVLPKPIYRSTHVNLDQLIKKIEKNLNRNNLSEKEYNMLVDKLKAAKKVVAGKDQARELFFKNIKSDGKYIYFCPVASKMGINDIDTLMQEVRTWLLEEGYDETDFVLYKSVSSEKDFGSECREAFYNDLDLNGKDASRKLKIMFAINQYNEGIHAPNIDGVILGRETKSDIIFFEQIGRALSVRGNGSCVSPVIIDFADNIEYIKELENSLRMKVDKKRKGNNKFIIDDVDIQDVSFDIEVNYHDLFNELRELQERFITYTWEDSYELARCYYNYHKHLGIPRNFRTDDGINYDLYGYRLGDWIAQMRRSKDKLSPRKIAKLERIGMIWKCYLTWTESYEVFKEYVLNNGIDSVRTNTVYKDVKIGEWLNNQKNFYRIGKLKEERKAMLEDLGVIWNFTQSWDDSYSMLCKFYEKYKHIKLPYLFKTKDGINYDSKGFGLYDWLRNQKTAYRENKLDDNQIGKLLDLGFDFEVKKTKKPLTLNDYKVVLSNFYKSTGAICATRGELHKVEGYEEEIDIARIIDRIKRKKDEGTLSLDDIKYFENLGIKWTSYVPKSWDEAYVYAVIFYEEYGHLKVSSSYKTKDGFDLGNWIYLQRKNMDTLSQDRKNRLNAIEMIWDTKTDRKKVLDIVEVNGINYKKNKVVIDAISLFEIKAKIRYLISQGISVSTEEGLHEIFNVSNDDLIKLIGIDYHTLLIKYLPKKDKESYVKSLQK